MRDAQMIPDATLAGKIAIFDPLPPESTHKAEAQATRQLVNWTSNEDVLNMQALYQMGKLKKIDLAMKIATALQVFNSPDKTAYCKFHTGQRWEISKTNSKLTKSEIRRRFYDVTRGALSNQHMQDVLNTLEAKALCEGFTHKVFVRVAEFGGKLYVDLADDQGSMIEISAASPNGEPNYGLIQDHEQVRFVRRPGMMALPKPHADATLADLNNLQLLLGWDSETFNLLLLWLIGALRASGPYMILVIVAEQGSGKSTVSRVIRALIDPSAVPLRTAPDNVRELMILGQSNHVIALDNLSGISQKQSDDVCRVSTGGGFGARELYSNDDEVLFDLMRPVVVNGIDDLCARGDFADRSLMLRLPPVQRESRKTEQEFYGLLEELRPRIFALLLNAMSIAIRDLQATRLRFKSLPRMADFALWVTAAEPALGIEQGTFLRLYEKNRQDSIEVTIDSSPLASAIRRLPLPLSVTSDTLLKMVAEATPHEAKSFLPKTAKGLIDGLRRVGPQLRHMGIEWSQDRQDGHRVVTVYRAEKLVSEVANVATRAG